MRPALVDAEAVALASCVFHMRVSSSETSSLASYSAGLGLGLGTGAKCAFCPLHVQSQVTPFKEPLDRMTWDEWAPAEGYQQIDFDAGADSGRWEARIGASGEMARERHPVVGGPFARARRNSMVLLVGRPSPSD